jgi:hypothetical protein
LRHLDDVEIRQIGARARQRVLQHHTAEHRAQELETHVLELLESSSSRRNWNRARETA